MWLSLLSVQTVAATVHSSTNDEKGPIMNRHTTDIYALPYKIRQELDTQKKLMYLHVQKILV